jgi:hypothetical protein
VDEKDDDFELEIVDLDDRDSFDGESDDEQSIFHALSTRKATTSSSNTTPLAPRYTLRQRRRQLVATVAIVGLLLCVLLSSYSPTRNQLIQAIVPPHPVRNVPSEPSSNFFYFDANPAWGQLFIDGKLVAHPPRNTDETPLELAQGHHMLRWQAQPFVTQLCGVSVPYNIITDTCHLNQFTHSTRGVGAWLFSFSTSLAQLPQHSFASLVTAVQSTLDAQAPMETVLSGERYGTNAVHTPLHLAKEPLKATLHYQLDVENNLDGVCSTVLEASTACTFNGQACYLFCTIPVSLMSSSAEKAWYVFVAAQATWEYTTISGRIVAQHQPELIGTATLYDHLLPLRILWNGTRWDVTLLFLPVSSDMSLQFNEPCNTALNAVRDVLFPAPAALAHVGINWLYASNTNPASGCLAMATLGQGAVSPPPVAYFLYRFGVFLAANDAAHKYWPTMPLADLSERQLAQQLATTV